MPRAAVEQYYQGAAQVSGSKILHMYPLENVDIHIHLFESITQHLDSVADRQ